MVRTRSKFGRNLSQVVETVPAEFLRLFLASCRTPDDRLLMPPEIAMFAEEEEKKTALRDYLELQDREILGELDRLSASVLEMGEDKGATSLETVAAERLMNDDYNQFEEKQDALCRSIWVHSHFPDVFRDGESFHAARRYRDLRKLYAAFEVDHERLVDLDELNPDAEAMCRKLEAVFELKARATASVLDLPETSAHPRSLMIALRHPGALSSIQDHRSDGALKTYYYRPSREVVLIYTPEQKKVEVCAESFSVRGQVADIFAEVVIGQDLSTKPLTKRDFNLDRFRRSFELDLPDLEVAEVISASVIEAEVPLGSFRRRLNLKVTKTDSIEEAIDKYVRDRDRLIRRFGFTKIAIAVEFVRRSTGAKGTFRLQVSGGNTSNVQSQRDPFLRDLGFQLLSYWGLMDELRPLTESEEAQWFKFLLALYDLPGDEVNGSFFVAASVDPGRLVQGGFLSRKSRDELVLIDEDGIGPVEVEVSTGSHKGTVTERGPFGEERGPVDEINFVNFKIDRAWLCEKTLKLLGSGLGTNVIAIETEELADLGTISLNGEAVSVYFVRGLGDPKVVDDLEVELRQRHTSGLGIVLTASEFTQRYLGPNVVLSMLGILAANDTGVKLDMQAIENQFRARRSLVGSSQFAQVIRQSPNAASLFLPGEDPLSLTTANQILFFERLVMAATDGSGEVLTKVLMEGMGSDHPKQLFSPKMREIVIGTYICHGSSNRYWRLAAGVRDLISEADP